MDRLAFSYIPRNSFLQRANPTFKLIYLILFSILISTAGNYEIYIYTVFLLVVGAICKLNLLKSLLSMPIMIAITFFIILTEWISTKAIAPTAREAISFLTLLIVAILFMATTDITELSASLGHYLEPLLAKNAWRLASNIMITIALIPIIFSSPATMMQPRRTRCGRFIQHPIRNITDYTISLILIIFKKAGIFEDALLSRAFSETATRKAKKTTIYDKLTLICMILATLAIFLIRRIY